MTFNQLFLRKVIKIDAIAYQMPWFQLKMRLAAGLRTDQLGELTCSNPPDILARFKGSYF